MTDAKIIPFPPKRLKSKRVYLQTRYGRSDKYTVVSEEDYDRVTSSLGA